MDAMRQGQFSQAAEFSLKEGRGGNYDYILLRANEGGFKVERFNQASICFGSLFW